jgi:hypothetical protein
MSPIRLGDAEDNGTEYVDDPAELSSLGDEESFSRQVIEMVANEAPRRFSLVEEIGERQDAVIVAWGIAFSDHAEVVSAAHDGTRAIFSSAEHARRRLSSREKIKIRLVWLDGEDRPRTGNRPSSLRPVDRWWGREALLGRDVAI